MSSPFSTDELKQPSETTFYAILERLEIGSKLITMDMFSPYYQLAKQLFPNAKIVLDRFHIVQHLSRDMNRVRIQIMNQFDRKSHNYSSKIKQWNILHTGYQFLLFHFQEKNSNHFFSLIEQEIATVNPIFQTVFKTFLKDKDKVLNAMELPYSNAKLEATNNLIKVIKRNAFGFRNFENFKKRILIALNIKKERTKFVLSRC